MAATLPKTRAEWKKALDALPDSPSKIPAFFFGHGSPALISPETGASSSPVWKHMGPKGPLAAFLGDFGPTLLAKYKPKAIVVFSGHWDTAGDLLVSDYGDENPLYYDYYGFPPSMYRLKFKSHGDSKVSQHVVELLKEAGIRARTSPKSEPRGHDGLGQTVAGFDHGVFVPFKIMFGEEFTEIPIIEVSFDGSMDPEKNWAIGQAIKKLREEQVLLLSGGLVIHNLRDFSGFSEETAKPQHLAFDKAVLDAVQKSDPAERKKALLGLTTHPGFRAAQPHEDHFIPLYVAAGAGDDGEARLISAIYGAPTVAFGL